MDIPGKLIISGFIIFFLVLTFVLGIENTAPAFTRTEFDNSCDYYLAVLSADGGLDITKQDELEKKLEALGLKDVLVNAPEVAHWGDKVTLEVNAKYIYKSINVANFNKEEKDINIKYKNATRVFGIEN